MPKYAPLTEHLHNAGADSHTLELTFAALDRIVGGLPGSARRLRTWWANGSNSQATAWRSAGWHVQRVDIPGARVVFARGVVGGSRTAGQREPVAKATRLAEENRSAPTAVVEEVCVEVRFGVA